MKKHLVLVPALIVVGAALACTSTKDAVESKAKAFVAQQAAIGKWTCEPAASDWLSPAKVVVVVESDNTFTLLEDTRPNNAVARDSSAATGSWHVVDGNLKIDAGGEAGRFESFDALQPGESSIEGFWGIEDNVDVDIKSANEFTIKRTPTSESPMDDQQPWTCTKE